MPLNSSCIEPVSSEALSKLAKHYEAMALELRKMLDQWK